MTYQEFINNILETRGRFNCGDEYHEKHHIIPKCIGGTNDEENLIDLFAKEHYIAHKLLMEENPENIKLHQAFCAMSFIKKENIPRYQLTPEEYEEARKILSTVSSLEKKELFKDKTKHPSYGKHISEERKKLIGDVNRGNKYCVGRIISEETRKKIGDANRNPSEETRKKMSKAQKIAQAGGKNSRAKKVQRISDGKIYDCMKDAALDNNISHSTFRYKMQYNLLENFKYYNF